MKTLIAVTLLLARPLDGARGCPESVAGQDQHVKWDADFTGGLKVAKEKGKFVVLHFTSEG